MVEIRHDEGVANRIGPRAVRGRTLGVGEASVGSAQADRRAARASSRTPPSEVRRPPSKTAVNFLRRMDGNANGKRVKIGHGGRGGLDAVCRFDGTVRNSVCGRRVEHQAAMARVKRSPKRTANCALAMTHSRGPIFHAFSERFKTK